MSSAATAWAHALEAWAIPPGILALASEDPWIHPPVLFNVPEVVPNNPSHGRAREVLGESASVLDVGCGGGIAAFALTPPASRVIGVDHQGEMLEMFAANAAARGLSAETHLGFWPAVASAVPRADVVTAHHVVYNVSDIVPFLRALSDHATQRVVLELPRHHPLVTLSGAWRHFWQLERPSTPTPEDLMAVLREMDIEASIEHWDGPMRVEQDLEQAAHFNRVRLCLPEEREGEVLEYMQANPPLLQRELATIWWNV
ncbi:MAG: class I SAM-dependent methyltransferase [Acidimicrobiaceae bacterium]|nr:class I SAM-dependent methyltransferase [Acidimicrobiaceae bacterium]